MKCQVFLLFPRYLITVFLSGCVLSSIFVPRILNLSSALRMRFTSFSVTSWWNCQVFFSALKRKWNSEKKKRLKAKIYFLFFCFFLLLLLWSEATHSSFLNGRSSSQPIRLTFWLRFPPHPSFHQFLCSQRIEDSVGWGGKKKERKLVKTKME